MVIYIQPIRMILFYITEISTLQKVGVVYAKTR